MKKGKGQKFPQVYYFGNLFDYFNNSFDYFTDLFVNVHDGLLHSWWLISSHSANQIFCMNEGDEEQSNWKSQKISSLMKFLQARAAVVAQLV